MGTAVLNELLAKLKLKHETALDDEAIKEYLQDAFEDIVDFTHQTGAYVQENLQGVIVRLAIERLNTKGAEGLKSQSYSGVSETYAEDISKPIKATLMRHRRLLK